MIVFPRNAKSPKAGEPSAAETKKHHESGHEGKVRTIEHAFPVSNKYVVEAGKVADYKSEDAAFRKLRVARSDARLVGKREKRAKAKEDEAAAAKK